MSDEKKLGPWEPMLHPQLDCAGDFKGGVVLRVTSKEDGKLTDFKIEARDLSAMLAASGRRDPEEKN